MRNMNHTITMGSLFDGIGGFPLAAVRCGVQPLWASEIEPFPIAVTRMRFPQMRHVGDITKLDGAKLPPVDIICGGSPCQDSAWPEQIRVIREMREADKTYGRTDIHVRPRFGVWENVAYALKHIRNIMCRKQLCKAPPKNAEKQHHQALFLCT